MFIRWTFAAAALAIAASQPAAAHIWGGGDGQEGTGFPAYQFRNATLATNTQPASLGFSFTVARSTPFGGVAYWDQGSDGFADAHDIKLYERAPDGTNLLRLATVLGPGPQGQFAYCHQPGSGLDGCWRWQRTFPAFDLQPGVTYTLAGYSPGSADPWPLDGEPEAFPGIVIGIDAARHADGALSDFPLGPGEPQQFETLFGYRAAAVNFGIVPEPASWSLLIIGFGLSGLQLRRARITPGIAAIAPRPRGAGGSGASPGRADASVPAG